MIYPAGESVNKLDLRRNRSYLEDYITKRYDPKRLVLVLAQLSTLITQEPNEIPVSPVVSPRKQLTFSSEISMSPPVTPGRLSSGHTFPLLNQPTPKVPSRSKSAGEVSSYDSLPKSSGKTSKESSSSQKKKKNTGHSSKGDKKKTEKGSHKSNKKPFEGSYFREKVVIDTY